MILIKVLQQFFKMIKFLGAIMVTGGPSGGFKKGPQVLNKMYDHFIIVVFDFVKNIERKKII